MATIFQTENTAELDLLAGDNLVIFPGDEILLQGMAHPAQLLDDMVLI